MALSEEQVRKLLSFGGDARLEIQEWYGTSQEANLYDWGEHWKPDGPLLASSRYQSELDGVWQYMAVNVLNYEAVSPTIKADKVFWIDVISGKNYERYFGNIKPDYVKHVDRRPMPLPHLVLVPGFPQDDDYLDAAETAFQTMYEPGSIDYLKRNFKDGDVIHTLKESAYRFLSRDRVESRGRHPLLSFFAATNDRFLRQLSEWTNGDFWQRCHLASVVADALAFYPPYCAEQQEPHNQARAPYPTEKTMGARVRNVLVGTRDTRNTSILDWIARYAAAWDHVHKLRKYVEGSETLDSDHYLITIFGKQGEDVVEHDPDDDPDDTTELFLLSKWYYFIKKVMFQLNLIDAPITREKGRFLSALLDIYFDVGIRTGQAVPEDITEPDAFGKLCTLNPVAASFIRQWQSPETLGGAAAASAQPFFNDNVK